MLVELRLTALTFVVCGLAYPLGLTVVAEALFPLQARGSLIRAADGRVLGSALVAQPREGAAWFQGRPPGVSNLGPTSQALAARLAQAEASLPAELRTQSGSGVDPHISPAAARVQIPRVAAARGLPETQVAALVDAHVEGRDLGVFGEPRVNVLRLNLALAGR